MQCQAMVQLIGRKCRSSSGANSENLQNVVFQINPSTCVGSASYAWQEGGCDSNSRVFNVFTKADEDSIGGCGFFGFGSPYSCFICSE
ncbi:hypothetical protein EBS43_06605 [bacterium]|jgi:hypothetical protein|nr:hypothetical protein [bacterium]